MKPEEQRTALAEWAGWKRHVVPLHDADGLITKLKTMIRWTSPGDTLQDNPYWNIREIPDYLNDLNAVHELEEKLPKETLGVYAMNLSRVVGYVGVNNSGEWLPHKAYIWHATAAQRCEAILKTLNIWKP